MSGSLKCIETLQLANTVIKANLPTMCGVNLPAMITEHWYDQSGKYFVLMSLFIAFSQSSWNYSLRRHTTVKLSDCPRYAVKWWAVMTDTAQQCPPAAAADDDVDDNGNMRHRSCTHHMSLSLTDSLFVSQSNCFLVGLLDLAYFVVTRRLTSSLSFCVGNLLQRTRAICWNVPFLLKNAVALLPWYSSVCPHVWDGRAFTAWSHIKWHRYSVGLMSHSTRYRVISGTIFTAQMTKPTVSKNGRKQFVVKDQAWIPPEPLQHVTIIQF